MTVRSFHSSTLPLGLLLGCALLPKIELLTPSVGLAQVETAVQEHGPQNRSLPAVRIQRSIEIDGRMDEPDWDRAPVAGDFVQIEPQEGELAQDQTEVRVLYDDENLYIGARMYDREPESIGNELTRRDEGGRAYGYVQVQLDPNLDRTTGYTFRLTAGGVHVDRYNYGDTNQDASWQAVWESAVQTDDEGWTAEIRIPFSQIRYSSSPEPQTWGLQVGRRNLSTNERSDWAFTPRSVHGGVSRWGALEGLELPERARSREVVPYVTGALERADADPANPLSDGSRDRAAIGLDFRQGLGSTFMLDAAVNPDFGQVEVDPAVVNLGAFETFFPEQRPFFTRDDRVFDFSLSGRREELFYSRRIGAEPGGNTPSGADFTDAPTETSILGAAKVTGRTAGGLTIGALGAVTDREHGRAYFADEDRVESFNAEPRTRYGVLRAEQDFRGAETRVGAIGTAVDRRLPGDGSLDHQPRRAFTGGVDLLHTWSDREWGLEGHLAGTHLEGDPVAMERVQRSPNHYFQRPDQGYMELDPHRTSLSGTEWRLSLERLSGARWVGQIWTGRRTPGFEVNDLGFSTDTEQLRAGGRLQYRALQPGDLFRSYRITLFTNQQWRNEVTDDVFSRGAWSHAHSGGFVNLNADFTFLNYWELGLTASYSPSVQSHTMTRGGPLMVDPGSRSMGIEASTDPRSTYNYQASAEYSQGQEGGYEVEVSAGVEARPANGLRIGLEPSYERGRDPAQYVATLSDGDFEPTYGDRYLFGEIQREELSIESRLSLVLSPEFTLEFFAQPFISAGDYLSFSQLAEAGTFQMDEFSEGEPVQPGWDVQCQGGRVCRTDGKVHVAPEGAAGQVHTLNDPTFNVRSLRGNAVLRWEFRPGSRLYVVWQQERSLDATHGTMDLGRDIRALADGPSEHVLQVKVDYWLDF